MKLKTQIVMKLIAQIVMKLKNSNCDETQIVIKIKSSHFDETKAQTLMKLKTQIVMN